ncbi:helix-turn-helix domain-containing protein [Carboxylicivirga linearis]|uniref:Helix-turn-helix domain-containing protein n=1 Tax=Carboxylicivirga linearis TaxID=1628157 RepID=A0ABS5JSI9_9BACT|nr:helix-turn-helix domain-containing protein [Carboxylicivirga linearis]MBS2097855.1 helix-turn-helix domain-containing protein [Carboxylicivirga linearis]
METGKLIKELRLKKGMTQEELADKTEVSTRTIQRIENGDVDPRSYTLQMIAKALEVDFSLFVNTKTDESDNTIQGTEINWLAFLHLSGLIPILIPTLLMWNRKKDKTKEMLTHFRAVVSFQLIILAISLAGLWVYWHSHQLIPFVGALLAGGLVSIVNTIQVLSGKPFIHPFFKHTDISRKG